MRNLNDLIDPSSGWMLNHALAINDQGWITGHGALPNGDIRAFLLTPATAPVPAPGAIALAGFGAGLVGWFRRRGGGWRVSRC